MRRTTAMAAAITLGLTALHAPHPATTAPPPAQHRALVPAPLLLISGPVAPNSGGTGSRLGGAARDPLATRAELAAADALEDRAAHSARASRRTADRPAKLTAKPAKSSAKTRAEKRKPTKARRGAGRSGHRAVTFALDQLGKPYIWGADGPAGYDCSGLTSAAWARAGVDLPHSSGGQARRGHRVSRAAARPGDLVVWSGHVAVYVGAGKVVHAPGRGRHITITHVWGNPTYRRIR